VILMDIRMPRLDGLGAIRIIKSKLPEVKIVVLTVAADDQDLFAAIKNGACGYLLKTQKTEDFFSLLEDLARGEAPLAPGLATRILHEFARQADMKAAGGKRGELLSARALQVLTLAAQGLSNKEVGARLFIAERTVKYHMGEILSRLHAENRAEVVEYARRQGLIK
jgi:two-component system NarL family response regulator